MNHRKSYPSIQDAMQSKVYLAAPGATVDTACPCGGIHVSLPRKVPAPRKAPGNTGPSPAVRKLVMDRDNGCCVRCGKPVANLPSSVHHRKRRSQGGRNDAANLILLCGTGTLLCHGYVHAHIAESQDAGWLVHGADDPANVPMLLASEHGTGITVWLTFSGLYSTQPPAGSGAAA